MDWRIKYINLFLWAARVAGKTAVLYLGDLLWRVIRFGASALMGVGQVIFY